MIVLGVCIVVSLNTRLTRKSAGAFFDRERGKARENQSRDSTSPDRYHSSVHWQSLPILPIITEPKATCRLANRQPSGVILRFDGWLSANME